MRQVKLDPPIGETLSTQLHRVMPRGIKGKAETPRAEWGFPNDEEVWRQPTEGDDGKRQRFESLFLGYYDRKNIVWYDDRHIFTCAGNRSGKGVSLIIPNLFIYENSVFVIDPKGENARKTIHRRKSLGQEVIVLDPFNTTGFGDEGSGQELSRYNPLSLIKPENQGEAISIAEDIASSIVISLGGRNSHFTDKARAFLKALILLVKFPPHDGDKLFDADDQHLGTVRALFNATHDNLQNIPCYKEAPRKALFQYMIENGSGWYEDIVSGAASHYVGNTSDEAQAVFSTLGNQLEFLDAPEIRQVLEGTVFDFSFEDMKRQPTSLFVCLPAEKMETHARWLRLLIKLALGDFRKSHDQLNKEKNIPYPVLMILDEFPVLGHMAAIQTAAGFIAGYGVKMWFIIQNIAQLQEHYKQSWETLIGNCGMRLFFGNSEPSTLDYVSKALGQVGMTVEEVRRSNNNPDTTGFGLKEDYRREGLLSVDEIAQIFRRESRLILVMGAGYAPMALERIVYYEKQDYFKQFDSGVL